MSDWFKKSEEVIISPATLIAALSLSHALYDRCKRNATAVVYAWQGGMPPRQLQIAVWECGDVLVRLRYETEREVREAKQRPLAIPWDKPGGGRLPRRKARWNAGRAPAAAAYVDASRQQLQVASRSSWTKDDGAWGPA